MRLRDERDEDKEQWMKFNGVSLSHLCYLYHLICPYRCTVLGSKQTGRQTDPLKGSTGIVNCRINDV
jgi:hypothetical protein